MSQVAYSHSEVTLRVLPCWRESVSPVPLTQEDRDYLDSPIGQHRFEERHAAIRAAADWHRVFAEDRE